MKNFIIEPTSNTPEVFFSSKSNQLKITGRSICFASEKFWNEIKSTLNKLLIEEDQLNVLLNFEYINTRNIKDLHSVLKSLSKDKSATEKLRIQWVYDTEDSNTKDLGEMLQVSSGVQFDLVTLN